jgi:hypothetical protein
MVNKKLLEEAQEVWGRTSEPGGVRTWAHWRRDKGEKFWAQKATDHVRRFKRIQQLSGTKISGGRAVEWGVGGGLNLHAFYKYFDVFYGIDISEPTLQECSREAEEARISNFLPLLVDISRPQSALRTVEPGSCSFALSTAVFHHFPSKEYAFKILRILYEMLENNGLCLIQYRWDDGSGYFRSKTRFYSRGKNCIRFTSHRISEFVEKCREVGFRVLSAVNMAHANCNYTYLQKCQNQR